MNKDVKKALDLAIVLHKNQFRKGTKIPYIVHIFDVFSNLQKCRAGKNLLIAGILHDSLEDTNYNKTKMITDFGKKVLKLVESNTEPENTPTKSRFQLRNSWKQRKSHTIQKLNKSSKEELLLCCADKLSNIRDISNDQMIIGNQLWKRFNASKEDVGWYYRTLYKIFKKRLNKNRMILEYDKLLKNTF